MTLSERNTFFKAAIVFCAASALLIIAASFLILPSYSILEENTRRPSNFFQVFLNWLFTADYLAVHASMALVVLFSFFGVLLIHSFFEQTTAPEILYFAFFTISFSFEVIRLIMPMHLIYSFPSLYLLIAGRILLFARNFGIFSLFAASICAAGLEVQRTRTIVTIIFVAALAITIGVPIDTQNWDSSFNIIYGYSYMFRLIEVVAVITTVISFFIAIKVRGVKEYKNIGIGLLLALVGRYLLLYTDNWAGVPGILLLSFGIWFACSKLHKIYLWL